MHLMDDYQMVAIPELLKAPEVGGVVLEVLHLNSNHRPGGRTLVVIIRIPNGEQVSREGRVEGLGQEDKLEGHLLLQLH